MQKVPFALTIFENFILRYQFFFHLAIPLKAAVVSWTHSVGFHLGELFGVFLH